MAARGEIDSRDDADRAITRLTGPLLGLIRIASGYLWFTQTLWKLPPRFGCDAGKGVGDGNGGLCDWVGKEIAYPQYGFYKDFLTGVVAPNLGTLGWLIWLGEALTMILLIFGHCQVKLSRRKRHRASGEWTAAAWRKWAY